jgi:hypothetical protein
MYVGLGCAFASLHFSVTPTLLGFLFVVVFGFVVLLLFCFCVLGCVWLLVVDGFVTSFENEVHGCAGIAYR